MPSRYALLLLPVIAVVFLTALVADIKGWFRQTGQPIATLTLSQGTVKRLPKNDLGWDYAQAGSGFAEGDAISVGETGQAKLLFKNGSLLELSEGSMMVIGSGDNEKLQLRFTTGQAKFRMAKKDFRNLIEVTEARHDKNANATSPSVAVEVVDTSQAIPVSEPHVARKTSPRKSDLTANSDQVLMATQLPKAPIPSSPTNDALLYLSSDESLALSWTADSSGPQAKSYEVAIRLVSETEPKIYKTDRNIIKIDQLPAGKYVWSIRGVGDSGLRGAASPTAHLELNRIAIVDAPPVIPPAKTPSAPLQKSSQRANLATQKTQTPALSKPMVTTKSPASTSGKVSGAAKSSSAKSVSSLKPMLKAPTLKPPTLMSPTAIHRLPAGTTTKPTVVYRPTTDQ